MIDFDTYIKMREPGGKERAEAWNALAQTQAGKSVLGTASKISGANLYTRLNY